MVGYRDYEEPAPHFLCCIYQAPNQILEETIRAGNHRLRGHYGARRRKQTRSDIKQKVGKRIFHVRM